MVRLIAAFLVVLTVALGTTSAAYASTATTPIRQEGYSYDNEQLVLTDAFRRSAPHVGEVAQFTCNQPAIDDRRVGVPGASTTPSSRSLATNTVGIPSSTDTKLQNYIDQLYKHANKPGTVGNGTTMDAIPGEIAAGGGRHIQKGEEIARGLRNWLSRNLNAPYCDRLLAQSLYDELVRALGYEPS